MQQTECEIGNILGLDARASALLVKAASRFSSEIQLSLHDIQANCKSIMGIMSLAAGNGSVITITADGNDEIAAIQAVYQIITGEGGEH
jgi:phosphocarrier protein HPr